MGCLEEVGALEVDRQQQVLVFRQSCPCSMHGVQTPGIIPDVPGLREAARDWIFSDCLLCELRSSVLEMLV